MGSSCVREVSGIDSAVVFRCSWVCCSHCGLTSAYLEGLGTGVGLTVISTMARLTTVQDWIIGGGLREVSGIASAVVFRCSWVCCSHWRNLPWVLVVSGKFLVLLLLLCSGAHGFAVCTAD